MEKEGIPVYPIPLLPLVAIAESKQEGTVAWTRVGVVEMMRSGPDTGYLEVKLTGFAVGQEAGCEWKKGVTGGGFPLLKQGRWCM